MRRILKACSLILLSIFMFGCGNNENGVGSITVYDVSKDPAEISLSKITTEVKPIFLKSSGNDFVRRVFQLEQNDEFIIISDGRSVFKFDIEGEFIGIIGTNGQGPGEYDLVKSLAVNWSRKVIYVATFNKIIQYNLEGDFQIENKVGTMIDGTMIVNGDLKILITEMGFPSSSPQKSITKNFLVGLNNNLIATDSLLIRSFEVNKNSAATLGGDMKFVSSVQNNDFLYMPVVVSESVIRDTLYLIDQKNLNPELKLDFGVKDKLEEKFLIKSILRSSNYLLASFFKASVQNQVLVNISKGTSFIGKNGFQDDFFQTGKAMLKPWNLENDEFFFSKDAYELEGVIDGVTEDDNPVLFILKVDK